MPTSYQSALFAYVCICPTITSGSRFTERKKLERVLKRATAVLRLVGPLAFVETTAKRTFAGDVGLPPSVVVEQLLKGTAAADVGLPPAVLVEQLVKGTAAADVGFPPAVVVEQLVKGTAAADVVFPPAILVEQLVKGTAAADVGFPPAVLVEQLVKGQTVDDQPAIPPLMVESVTKLSSATDSAAVTTSTCPDPISLLLTGTITNKVPDCDCLPNTVEFAWTGTRWNCLTSSGSCAGPAILPWYIQPIGAGFVTFNTGTVGGIVAAACGPPFTFSGTFNGDTACPGGTFDLAVTE